MGYFTALEKSEKKEESFHLYGVAIFTCFAMDAHLFWRNAEVFLLCFSPLLYYFFHQRKKKISHHFQTGCFTVTVISRQSPYPDAGGLGFYLSNIVAIVQSDGLGKEMTVHTALPKGNPMLDDWENVPTSLVKFSLLCHSLGQLLFFLSVSVSFPLGLCLKSALGP